MILVSITTCLFQCSILTLQTSTSVIRRNKLWIHFLVDVPATTQPTEEPTDTGTTEAPTLPPVCDKDCAGECYFSVCLVIMVMFVVMELMMYRVW